MQRFLTAWLIVLSQLLLSTSAQTEGRYDKAFQEPMRFVSFNPCLGSASFCSEAVVGVGKIESDTYKLLSDKFQGQNLYLHSPGGSLLGGIALGNKIRLQKLNTIVGGEIAAEEINSGENELVTLVSESICASACAYAFLGGIRREISNERSYLLHQFSTGGQGLSEDISQEVVGQLISYAERMGADGRILAAALLTPPERLTYLNYTQLWNTKVFNSSITGGIPSELIQAIQGQKNNWKLSFPFPNSTVPAVQLERLTEKEAGTIKVWVYQVQNNINITYQLIWKDNFETLDKVYTVLTKHGDWNDTYTDIIPKGPQTSYICFQNSDSLCAKETDQQKVHATLGTPYLPPTLVHQVQLANWKRLSRSVWELQVLIPSFEFKELVLKKPKFLLYSTDLPNVYNEFNFDFPIELTEEFWKIGGLINQETDESITLAEKIEEIIKDPLGTSLKLSAMDLLLIMFCTILVYAGWGTFKRKK